MIYTYKMAEKLVQRELHLQRTHAGSHNGLHIPGILGGVGSGKTTLAKSMAATFGLKKLVQVNCGEEADPTEVLGMWRVDQFATLEGTRKVKKKGGFVETELHVDHAVWILNKRAAEACAFPCLLLLDDIDKAKGVVQNALLALLGERRVRDQRLHRDTLVICAGNRVGDDIQANELTESLRTRVTFFTLTPSIDDFLEYGHESGEIHPSILGFLKKNSELLHQPDPQKLRFPTPRGWRECSQHFEAYPQADEMVGPYRNWEEAVSRKCGEGVGSKFWAWHEILSKIDVERIFRYGDVEVPDPLQQFAAVWAISSRLRDKPPTSAPGLDRFFMEKIEPEIRAAIWAQIPEKARPWFSKHCATTAAAINNAAVTLR